MPKLQHKHIPYGKIQTTMSDDNKSSLTEPLVGSGDEFHDAHEAVGVVDDPNIPPLNAEDPLFGLRSAQVKASRDIFGMNEIVIPETPLWKLFLHQFVGFLVSLSVASSIGAHESHLS